MTNKELQVKLDENKYDASYKAERDLSGYMDYCEYCDNSLPFSSDIGCGTTQKDRETNLLCAQAYGRMKRAKKKHN